jgi:hypothetical protein
MSHWSWLGGANGAGRRAPPSKLVVVQRPRSSRGCGMRPVKIAASSAFRSAFGGRGRDGASEQRPALTAEEEATAGLSAGDRPRVAFVAKPKRAELRERLPQRAAEEATTPIAVANRPKATTTLVIAQAA